MKLKSKQVLLGAGALVLAAGAGYAGGEIAVWHMTGQAQASVNATPANGIGAGTTPVATSLPGLTVADAKWVEGILTTPVHDASGHVVRVSAERPILVVA
ncbi:hypothetical protein [Alicyclobacillus macrosporangiidus]|uniref:hypothetical protein n=1 Tax=Alicyclobacillus macrosporangiidus TaxID=392015 RepID=UPI00049850A2|nr:hypothetical protein [Alicyclobacillus macrosporangiidus]